jgi:hypothetical protein
MMVKGDQFRPLEKWSVKPWSSEIRHKGQFNFSLLWRFDAKVIEKSPGFVAVRTFSPFVV